MAILRSSLPLPKSGPKGKVTLGAVIGAMDAVAGMTPVFSLRLRPSNRTDATRTPERLPGAHPVRFFSFLSICPLPVAKGSVEANRTAKQSRVGRANDPFPHLTLRLSSTTSPSAVIARE